MKVSDIEQMVDSAASAQTIPKNGDSPLIGLTSNIDGNCSKIDNIYAKAIIEAGGTPVLIPATEDIAVLTEVAGRIDGLLMTGGGDIDPDFYDEKPLSDNIEIDSLRDKYEMLLLQITQNRGVPIFGICRGIQIINVFFGGTLYQDLPSQHADKSLEHMQVPTDRSLAAHKVTVFENSKLADLVGSGTLDVNSRHHQAIKTAAPTFTVSAVATDGVVEAIENFESRRVFAVQWHPENMAVADNKSMQALFGKIVEEAKIYARAKKIHSENIIVDSHVDTPMFFSNDESIDIGRRDPKIKVDLVKMTEGKVDAVFMVAYLKQGERNVNALEAATQKATNIINAIKRQVANNADRVAIATTFDQIEKLKKEGKKSIVLGIENGYAIGKKLENIEFFKNMGVCYMTLSHNGDNDICDSASGTNEHGGLSNFGRDVVREMNRVGMMIDISHTSHATTMEVIAISKHPVIASHSSAKGIYDHKRNLSDEAIRALAAKGGVVNVCLYHGFIDSTRSKANLSRAVDHIDHIRNLVGIDYIGVGSDFDGDGGIAGCDNASEMMNITSELLRRGYTEADIAKIWGGNLRRVMETVQK